MSFPAAYLEQTARIAQAVDAAAVERMVSLLVTVRERGGRVFFVGVGGGAGHASHAVCDFRKLGHFECYSVSDNVSELTARINDEGWETADSEWLKGSKLPSRD